MFVHLAVPVTSPSAFSSKPTSTFCDFYFAQYCRDFANYTIATQRETRKARVSFLAEYCVFRLDLCKKLGNSLVNFFMHQKPHSLHNGYVPHA